MQSACALKSARCKYGPRRATSSQGPLAAPCPTCSVTANVSAQRQRARVPDHWPSDAGGRRSPTTCRALPAPLCPGPSPALVCEHKGVPRGRPTVTTRRQSSGQSPPGRPPFLPSAGLTWWVGGAGENLLAQTRNMSGCGFPLFTSGSSPNTMWSNKPKKAWCLPVFMSNDARLELVATARGTPCRRRWRISLSTPGEEGGKP